MVSMGEEDKIPMLFVNSQKPYRHWHRQKLVHTFVPSFQELKKSEPSTDIFFRVISHEVHGDFEGDDFIESTTEEPLQLYEVGTLNQEEKCFMDFNKLIHKNRHGNKIPFEEAEYMLRSYEMSHTALVNFLVNEWIARGNYDATVVSIMGNVARLTFKQPTLKVPCWAHCGKKLMSELSFGKLMSWEVGIMCQILSTTDGFLHIKILNNSQLHLIAEKMVFTFEALESKNFHMFGSEVAESPVFKWLLESRNIHSGMTLRSHNNETPIKSGFLTEAQQACVNEIASSSPLSLINAPPGSGKSTLFAEAEIQAEIQAKTLSMLEKLFNSRDWPITATTLGKLKTMRRTKTYDLVIQVDEASLLETKDLLMIISKMRYNVKVVLIGDANQLPPKTILGSTKVSDFGNLCRIMNYSFLDVSFLSTDDIVRSWSHFYSKPIRALSKAERSQDARSMGFPASSFLVKTNYRQFDVKNEEEAESITRIVKQLEQRFGAISEKFLVLSYYERQKQLLQKKLGREYKVKTIDSCQGSEANIVIIATSRVGTSSNHLNEQSRAVVGLSRAKKLSICLLDQKIVNQAKIWSQIERNNYSITLSDFLKFLF